MVRKLLFVAAVSITLAITSFQVISLAAEKNKDGGTIIYTKPLREVTFSHKAHTKNGMTCDFCHPRIFKMEALSIQNKADFTMKGLAEGKYCGACHNGAMAFLANSRCPSCHTGSQEAREPVRTKPVKDKH